MVQWTIKKQDLLKEDDALTTNLLCEAKDLNAPITHGKFREPIQCIDALNKVLVKASTTQVNGKGVFIIPCIEAPTDPLGVLDD